MEQVRRPFLQWIQNCLNEIQVFFHAMDDRKVIELILAINVMIIVVYMIIHLLKRQWKKGILISVFMLSMPIVGPMYLLFGEILHALQKVFGDRNVSLEELSFNKSRVRLIPEADAERERNIVPLEEALLVSGRNEKRQALLDMIKGEEIDDLGAIRRAVADQDPEIAHYAASYVADLLTSAKAKEASLRKEFEDKQTAKTCDDYVRHLRFALELGLFEGMERRRYLGRLEAAYLWKLDHDPQNCTVEDMAALMRQWMQIHDMEKAAQWFERIRPMCYENLDAFKACAIFYYSSQDRDALLDLLSEVRGSALILDSEALEWIRFFSSPAGCVG